MNAFESPEIRITKNTVPLIYLDTNIMTELAKYENGSYKGAYLNELKELYNLLNQKMRQNEIICPLGYQMEEMGMPAKRKNARNFLYRFTNAKLQNPLSIEKEQADIGYHAYHTQSSIIALDTNSIIEKAPRLLNSTIELHISTIYSQEKTRELKKEKAKLADDLNSLKQTKRKANLDAQIAEELTADLQVFLYNLTHYNNSIDEYIRNDYALREIYHRVGIKQNPLHEEKIAAVEQHNRFLVSSYHHNLPYKWIRSVLWAHLMQRQNIIQPSDHNDIVWASAYLPFVDYAVTDIAFCNLLHESNLATQYGTKVFSFPSLQALIDEMKSIDKKDS